MLQRYCSVLVLALVLGSSAWGSSPIEIERRLREFHANPSREMNARLPRRDASGHTISEAESRFPENMIRDRSYVDERDRMRRHLKVIDLPRIPAESPLAAEDESAANLVDNADRMVTGMDQMEQRGLKSSKLRKQPWSDWYWPFYQGVLGVRYGDSRFPRSVDWMDNFKYVTERSVLHVMGLGPGAINELSPSEKYELLIGDNQGRLTAQMWDEGRQYYDSEHKVETWMGICHGWAPASYMLARPEKALIIPGWEEGVELKFYPSDIKGLASLLWANASPSVRYLGRRCSDKNPKTDANGRVISSACFDVNPGVWHKAVVNQIGVSKRSFVIDASYDYEVWNQPMVGYSYSYFNPQTLKASDSLEEAVIPKRDYKSDKFTKYRSSGVKYFVGVSMDVTYTVETRPMHAETDSEADDELRTTTYTYDLELDSDMNIIGGEWYTNLHPDFMWNPAPGARAVSIGDHLAIGNEWNGRDRIPSSWREGATRSLGAGQPLARIVEALIALSAGGD